MLGYSVRGLFRVLEGEAWPESFVLDHRKMRGVSHLLRVQGDAWPEPRVLGSGRGPSTLIRVHPQTEIGQ